MSTTRQMKRIESLTREMREFIARAILFNLKVAEEVGLNGTDLQCLNLLNLQGSTTPGELARWSCLTTGGMTVVLDRLERAGYVKREDNPNDRRSSVVRPVRRGMQKLEAIYRSRGEALARAASGYDERELKLILDFFKKANSASDERQ